MPIFLALVALLPVAFAQAEEPEGLHITYRPVTGGVWREGSGGRGGRAALV